MSSASLSPPSSGGRTKENAPFMTESRKVGRQVVFRVRDPRARAQAQARRAPRHSKAMTTDDSTKESAYHARKSHRKSRAGCGNCKRRRVKCDEGRPGCQKCDAYGIQCDYTSTSGGSESESPPANQAVVARRNSNAVDSIDATASSLSVMDLVSKVNNVLQMGNMARSGYGGTPLSSSSDTIVSLRNYIYITNEYGYMPNSHRHTLGTDVVQLAFSSPYLMHAVLGAALTTGRFINRDKQQRQISEGYHWQQAIRLYQQDLVSPIGPHNMDQLLSTCILLSIVSFSEHEYNPRDSWLFSTDNQSLNWLLVQSGLRYLIYATIPWLKDSIWRKPFAESDADNKHAFDDHRPGPEGLHPELAQLCDIYETTTEDDNAYHWPLRLLTPLMKLETNRHNFTNLCGFMGRMEPSYLELLKKRDERAVLLFGYWLAKVCEDSACYAYPRWHSECLAICMFLEHSHDPRILRLLRFPAERCGYVLRHVTDVTTGTAEELQLEDLLL